MSDVGRNIPRRREELQKSCCYSWTVISLCVCVCLIHKGALHRYVDLTHAQKQALVFLDGTQATEKARYHDDGANGDDHVGSRQRGERG